MWADLLPTLLLLQSIAVQAQPPPVPKKAIFTQIACTSITGSRKNQLSLYDGDGKLLGNAYESCSLISPCKVEGVTDITVGPYILKHPQAIFGPCGYKDFEVEITTTDEPNTVKQKLYATCEYNTFLCGEVFGQINMVQMRDSPSVNQTSIVLREYNKDGCPADQNFSDQISSTGGCTLITGTGITNVVVVPKPNMPRTCVLTLYAETNCLTPSSADIGPIAPSVDPSACIGPIRNPKGDVFEAKAAILEC